LNIPAHRKTKSEAASVLLEKALRAGYISEKGRKNYD